MILMIIVYVGLIGSVVGGYFISKALSELSEEGKSWWFPIIFLGLYPFASHENFTDLGWHYRKLALKTGVATFLLIVLLIISHFIFAAS